MSDEVNVKFGAQIAPLLHGMEEASSSVKTATEEMAASFAGLKGTVENLSAPFAAFLGLLAGGAAFREAIDGAKEYDIAMLKLSRTTGESIGQASALNIALDDLFVPVSTYERGIQMLNRSLSTGGEKFAAYGIATKDANGHLRSAQAIMLDTIDKLNDMKAGTDRNVAGTQLFGRAWAEVSPILKLNREALGEATGKAEALNLVLTNQGADALQRYRAAMNDAGDVMEGFKKTIGEAVMPALSTMAEWFAERGPAAIEFSRKAFVLIAGAVDVFVADVQLGWIVIQGFAEGVGAMLGGLAQAAEQALHGDFKGAQESVATGFREMKVVGSDTADALGDRYVQLADDLAKLANPLKRSDSVFGGKGGNGDADPNAGKEKAPKSQLGEFKQELEDQKDLEANWFTWSKEREIEFWADKLSSVKTGSADQIAIYRDMNKLRREIASEAQKDDEKAAAKQLAEFTKDSEEKMRVFKEAHKREYEEAKKAAEEQDKLMSKAFAPLTKAWDTALAGMLSGTMTFTQGIRSAWTGMGKMIDQMIVKMVDGWIAAQLKTLAITVATKARELFVHLTTNTAKTASTAASATAEVGSNAAAAGSAAAASAAQTPGIGWLIAIPAALAVIGGVLAMRGNIASASGGWGNVPSDQLAMIHKNEMVLPASIAQNVREMTSGGSGGGEIHVHVHAFDAQGVNRMVRNNRSDFSKALQSLARNRVMG